MGAFIRYRALNVGREVIMSTLLDKNSSNIYKCLFLKAGTKVFRKKNSLFPLRLS